MILGKKKWSKHTLEINFREIKEKEKVFLSDKF